MDNTKSNRLSASLFFLLAAFFVWLALISNKDWVIRSVWLAPILSLTFTGLVFLKNKIAMKIIHYYERRSE